MAFNPIIGNVKWVMGADEEVCVWDRDRKVYIDAASILPPQREAVKVHNPGAGGSASDVYGEFYRDGFNLEFGITQSHCRAWLTDHWRITMLNIFKYLQKQNFSFEIRADEPVVSLTPEQLEALHPESKIFGCEPDLCGYSGEEGTKPTDASQHPFRYAGGHVHIEIGIHPVEVHAEFVQLLDLMVGVPSILFAQSPLEAERRKKYGKAGSFRIKTKKKNGYDGHEYRTLSNWFNQHPHFMNFVFGSARTATELMFSSQERNKDARAEVRAVATPEKVKEVINANDVSGAMAICEDLYKLKWEVSSEYYGAEPSSAVPFYKKKVRASILKWGEKNLSAKLDAKSKKSCPFGGPLFKNWDLAKQYNTHNGSGGFESRFDSFTDEVMSY